MDTIPQTHSLNLPQHVVISPNGDSSGERCVGTEVAHVDSDVGVIIGKCLYCAEEFVYLPKTNSWVTQKEFDAMLVRGAGELGSAIRSL